MALERTFTLDVVKQEYSTSGVVTRQGEFGETIVFRLFAGGANYVLSPTVDRVKLKGITNDNKYIELDGTIQVTSSNTNAKVVLTKDWNSASGAFKVVYLEVKKASTAQTSTVNLDWFVLPEANVTDKDVAHYVDELQEIIDRMEATAESYLQQLTDKLAQANAELDTLRNNINTAEANLSSKITALEARLNTEIVELEAKIAKAQQDLETLVSGYESRVAQALADFENGNFYTKPEADSTFMKKGEIPDTIQKFKLTADDGQPLPVPSDITSFNDLAKLTGYFYVPRATAITYTDQNSLPINFRNAGLFVSMPVGQPTNAYRYQEIKLNSTTFARTAYRNTNGVSSTPWVEVANEASIVRIDDTVSDQGRRIATNTMNISTNTSKITALETPKYWKGYFTAGNNVEPIRHRSRMGWGKLLTTQAELDGLQPMEAPFTIEPLFLTAKRDIKFILRGHFYLQGSGGSNPRWAYAHARINTDGGEATGSATPMGSVQNGASGIQWKNWAPFTALLTMKAGEKLAFSMDVDESQTGKQVDRGHVEQFYIQEVPADPVTLEVRSYAADHEGIYN